MVDPSGTAQGVKVYVAGPLGFSTAGKLYHDDVVLPQLVEAGFEPLDPWDLPPELDHVVRLPDGDPVRVEKLAGVNVDIGRRNAEMIRAADAILAFLDGPDVDSGTAAEIGFADALEKLVIGVRTDTRKCGDNEAAIVNLRVVHQALRGHDRDGSRRGDRPAPRRVAR